VKTMADIYYCILNGSGIIGAYSAGADGNHTFSPILLRGLPGAERLARKLPSVTKCRHDVSLYDRDTGAVLKAPKTPPSSYGKTTKEKE